MKHTASRLASKSNDTSAPFFQPLLVQPKLKINEPGDAFEQEADQMADTVMRMPASVRTSTTETDVAFRKTETPSTSKGTGTTDVDHTLSKSSSQPLSGETRRFFEPRFGHDFSDVRVHTDSEATTSAEMINAKAFTAGNHIFFNKGKYSPDSGSGQKLLAHELTHVVQQNGTPSAIQRDDIYTPLSSPGPRGGLSIHSPVIDELLTQGSDVHAAIAGRGLFPDELAVVQNIFGKSVDYTRVRLILGDVGAGTTAGNNIRLPAKFDITKPENQQLLVHEMTHVWQFQHYGAGYITTSLLQQLSASASRGNRNFAYDYHINSNNSFFEFAPEQQAFIVENYFAMLRDQAAVGQPDASTKWFKSNHLDAKGFNANITSAQRSAEIQAELPMHEKLVRQMSSTPFLSKQDLLAVRQKNVLITGPDDRFGPPPGGSGPQFLPTPNLFEIRFGSTK